MSEKAIETLSLTKYYGKNIGIEDVNLQVDQGEVFGFIGPNGAGKSTTIRTLLNLLFPSSGKGRIFGFDIVKQTGKIKQITGYLPAEVNYYYKMAVKELLEYSQRYYKKCSTTKITELCNAFELNLKMKIRDLSMGNKKKVSIVQSLLHEPELLILDEPTSGLDPLVQSTFFEILDNEKKRGVTIFFSSHVLSDVQKICSRVAIIQKGKIINMESIDSLRKKMLKKIKIELIENFDFSDLKLIGTVDLTYNEHIINFLYNGDINYLISRLSGISIKNITIEEPSLEEIFLHYYKNAGNNHEQ